MQTRYRFLHVENDLKEVLAAANQDSTVLNRKKLMVILRERLREKILELYVSGVPLHDSDVQRVAQRLGAELRVPHFTGSLRWVKLFHKQSRIVSRKIT